MTKPLQLAFDPMHDDNLRRVFEDDIARKFWLLYRPYCVVSGNFWCSCLGLAEIWRRDKPKNALEFSLIIGALGEWHGMPPKEQQAIAKLLFDKMSEPEPSWEVID